MANGKVIRIYVLTLTDMEVAAIVEALHAVGDKKLAHKILNRRLRVTR